VVNLLGSGRDFGCHFTYKVQDEAGGIAQALGLAENFAGDSSVCVLLGDNIFEDSIQPFVSAWAKQKKGARIVLKQVQDPQRYGVAEVKGERITGIVEKPKAPKSDLAVTGIYFYDAGVYDVIRTLKPSGRGELEITDVNNHYLREGQLRYDVLQGWWTDAGTFDSLHFANELVAHPLDEPLKLKKAAGRARGK
jgi:glucose-1-phosphate thymidylyltransferase